MLVQKADFKLQERHFKIVSILASIVVCQIFDDFNSYLIVFGLLFQTRRLAVRLAIIPSRYDVAGTTRTIVRPLFAMWQLAWPHPPHS